MYDINEIERIEDEWRVRNGFRSTSGQPRGRSDAVATEDDKAAIADLSAKPETKKDRSLRILRESIESYQGSRWDEKPEGFNSDLHSRVNLEQLLPGAADYIVDCILSMTVDGLRARQKDLFRRVEALEHAQQQKESQGERA